MYRVIGKPFAAGRRISHGQTMVDEEKRKRLSAPITVEKKRGKVMSRMEKIKKAVKKQAVRFCYRPFIGNREARFRGPVSDIEKRNTPVGTSSHSVEPKQSVSNKGSSFFKSLDFKRPFVLKRKRENEGEETEKCAHECKRSKTETDTPVSEVSTGAEWCVSVNESNCLKMTLRKEKPNEEWISRINESNCLKLTLTKVKCNEQNTTSPLNTGKRVKIVNMPLCQGVTFSKYFTLP